MAHLISIVPPGSSAIQARSANAIVCQVEEDMVRRDLKALICHCASEQQNRSEARFPAAGCIASLQLQALQELGRRSMQVGDEGAPDVVSKPLPATAAVGRRMGDGFQKQ